MVDLSSLAEAGATAAVGALQKLWITHDTHSGIPGGPIIAMFNPTEISRHRSISWKSRPVASTISGWGRSDWEQQYLSTDAETMSLELFFDTYEAKSPIPGLVRAGLRAVTQPTSPRLPNDVRLLTDQVAKLAEVDRELHHPPVCHLAWGMFRDLFTGVVTQLDQRFTMFLADGTPVRATVSCTFAEFHTKAHASRRELHSADVHKTRVVRRSDTLQSLAAEEYGDPRLWRHIARENGIRDPRTLVPGTVLRLPRLDR